MKGKIPMKPLFLVCALVMGSEAGADFSPDLYRYFDQKVRQVTSSIRAMPVDNGGNPPLLLQDVNVDLAATVSFGISGVLDLSISPELDFVVAPETD